MPRNDFPLPTNSPGAPSDLAGAYRNLYLEFASGDRKQAINRAAAFERATLARDPKKGFDKLSAADTANFSRIEAKSRRSLLALSLFYRELASRYSAEHDFGLLSRANRSTEEILRRLKPRSDEAGETGILSAAYQSFALDLLDIYAEARAAEMLERATELEPGDVPAQIALSFLLQRDGRYAAAAVRLDRALAAAPEDREARLRRAVLRARVAPEGKAAKELEALAESPEKDWMTIVAWQERARGLLSAGHYKRAIGWLEKARIRFPEEPSFPLALAYCLATSDRRDDAGAMAGRALAVAAEHEVSARKHFAALPTGRLAPQRQIAQIAAETRWPELRAALASDLMSDSEQ